MGLFDWFGKSKQQEQNLSEAIGSFKTKGENLSDKQMQATKGEGYTYEDFVAVQGFGKESMSSFNQFHSTWIDNQFADQMARLQYYRMMAEMPEIAAVIEDIIVESTQENQWGYVMELEILDPEMDKNDNIKTNIEDEFENLFFRKIGVNNLIFELIRTYFVDGKLFIEKVINTSKPALGIVGLKKLPTETMDYFIDINTGKITGYVQYLSPQAKKVTTVEEAEKEKDCILFYPEQIIYMDYGIYGRNRKEVLGYLEKAKQPFNQLKLLETSVVIYRIVKSPERLVFKIDTGAMPIDKAMKFVEKVRTKFTQQVGYNKSTGKLENEPNVISMLDNYYLPQSADGRGSDITSIGGNPAGFAELGDIYYFLRKLYMALKYPMSRVMNMQEGRDSDNVWFQGQTAQISRDEIRWSKFLERHQNKFEQMFLDLFLLHLEFKGLKKEYELDRTKLNVLMVPPNNYKDQMRQMLLESQMSNYNTLAGNAEFSKSFMMQHFLDWDEEMIEANAAGLKKDKILFPGDQF